MKKDFKVGDKISGFFSIPYMRNSEDWRGTIVLNDRGELAVHRDDKPSEYDQTLDRFPSGLSLLSCERCSNMSGYATANWRCAEPTCQNFNKWNRKKIY